MTRLRAALRVPLVSGWRRRQPMERGAVTTRADLAAKECFCDRHAGRMIRPACLSPSVPGRPVLWRDPTEPTLMDLCGVTALPWADQRGRVFD